MDNELRVDIGIMCLEAVSLASTARLFSFKCEILETCHATVRLMQRDRVVDRFTTAL